MNAQTGLVATAMLPTAAAEAYASDDARYMNGSIVVIDGDAVALHDRDRAVGAREVPRTTCTGEPVRGTSR